MLSLSKLGFSLSVLASLSSATKQIVSSPQPLFLSNMYPRDPWSSLTNGILPAQVPGATWTAAGTNQHMQAHGGGIVESGGVYYQIGENKLNGSAFQSINCYSSTVCHPPSLPSLPFFNLKIP